MLITSDILKKIVPLVGNKAETITNLINEICPKYGINNADILHEFIAQLAHESGAFQLKTENLNYSAKRLLEVFPKYFSKQTALQYQNNPQMIANIVYAARMGNGSINSGDGWKYRGGGFIQATGKSMYQLYAAYKKMDADKLADLVRTDDTYAMDISCWIFAIEKKLIQLAIADDMITITKRINGGTKLSTMTPTPNPGWMRRWLSTR